MTIYLPVYSGGKRLAEKLESDACKFRKRPGYSATIFAYGGSLLFNGDAIFSDERGVDAYWRGDYTECKKYLLAAENVFTGKQLS